MASARRKRSPLTRLPPESKGLMTNGAAEKEATRAYQPLASVWQGSDAALLDKLLDFYPREPPKLILDATVNAGRFWVGSRRNVIGLDIEPRHRPNVVADNTRMPFKDDCFDVVVYDPPHIPNQGKDRQKDFNADFRGA